MSAPQGGYPPQQGGQPLPPEGYGTPPPAGGHGHSGGKKKRAYAGEAFELGSGANAALGGQPKAGGDYPAYAAQAAAAGYPPEGYGTDPNAGYVPPPPLYQTPTPTFGAATGDAGVAQITQQFGQMGVSDPSRPAQPGQQAPRPVQLNQLYPTDLLTQPFNVAELDYPPPPIILPPNVRIP